MSRGRRLAGPAALVATAGGLAAIAVHDTHWVEWGLLAYSGVIAAAGIGLARRSMAAQVLSRGAAWTVLVPSALVTLFSFASGHPEGMAVALAAGSGGALLLARPMLRTAEAHAEFAPSSFRRWLLAGATASVTAGMVSAVFGLDGLRWHPGSAIPLLVLAFSLLASAVGVVRMRAWGILLGALTSVVTLVAAAFMHDAAGLLLALASIPGLMLTLPVIVAQRERAKAEATSFTRVSSHVSFDDAPSRVRIATESENDLDLDADDEAQAQRVQQSAPAVPSP